MARGRAKQATDTTDVTQPEFASVEDGRTSRSGRVRPVKRARLGVVVLTVLVTEIVLIAAGANQGVAKHLASYASDHPSSLLGHLVRSLLIFRWRVSPSGSSDLWHTELITIGLVLLLGIVLVPMVVHGPVSWLNALLGSWFAITVSVVVATVAAVVLADLEESRDLAMYVVPGTPSRGLSIGNKISGAVFGPLLSYAFVAGLALGLVVALITATVVASTRRTDPVPVAVAPDAEPASNPETPQPFFGSNENDRDSRSGGYGATRYADSSPYADSHPYAAPDRRAAEETTTFPAVGAGQPRSADDRDLDRDRSDPAPSEATTTLPRVGTDRPPATSDAGATSELPRTEAVPAQTPQSSEAAQTSDASQATEPTQAWPAQPGSTQPGSTQTTEAETTGSGTTGARTGEAESTATERAEADSERTAAFPVPPDDEDLGHHPDRHDD